jgi:predicted anti-sigma-YlaC factor YlaD
MIHIDEDLLLKYALQLLEDKEQTKIQEHLIKCDQCKKHYESIKSDIELIGSIELDVEQEVIPLPKKKLKITKQWIRAAAILIIGFFIGYITANLAHPVKVEVVKQKLLTKTILYPIESFRTCEQVDLDAKYYSE